MAAPTTCRITGTGDAKSRAFSGVIAAPVANWALNGVIQPLDKFIASSHYDMTQLVPGSVKQVSWRGRVWGLPLVADTYWLWYRVQDFKEAGKDTGRAVSESVTPDDDSQKRK